MESDFGPIHTEDLIWLAVGAFGSAYLLPSHAEELPFEDRDQILGMGQRGQLLAGENEHLHALDHRGRNMEECGRQVLLVTCYPVQSNEYTVAPALILQFGREIANLAAGHRPRPSFTLDDKRAIQKAQAGIMLLVPENQVNFLTSEGIDDIFAFEAHAREATEQTPD